ncbi:nicotinate-nucleotide adenylyltransferase [Desulfonema ishimotonii]|uniref:Nicotinate-nucleotide adenylyltransferase n=1 Tax=Desulfonema ishimotonii TaxID=45657 RepID=A0A401G163_9BACT|nr:nicotinate-nucleotide adenylyltransferase [Desulfonema ishimotonii]GBC62950.1 nicotinate-nucleotide adenylyltransferase [Desulfonema ishimotonii]
MTESQKTDSRLCDTGVIHGRFQVCHNDHLRYLLSGKALCRHLVVGITNPDPFMTRTESADTQRNAPLANPLTYYERYHMLRSVLRDAGIAEDEFSIVPLPINLPERYQYYVPMDAVFFLSIYDDWGRRKRDYFLSLRLRTHILWEVSPAEKGISAKDVRELMMAGRPWHHLVPSAVPPLMERWGIAERLRCLAANPRC